MTTNNFERISRRCAHAVVGIALAGLLTGCGGGGGNSGTPVLGPDSGASSPASAASAVAADLVVVLSKTAMANSGSDSITATVTSVDANRAAVGGVPVSFTVNANAVVTPVGTSTDAKTGVLTATVTQGNDVSVRPVTLSVTSGAITRSVRFNIVQSSSTTNPQASDLALTLSAANIDNSGSKTVAVTATAVDGGRNALPGIPVQLSVSDASNSAFIVVPSTQTSASGQVSGTVSIGQDRSNRTVTVVATSGTLTRTTAFQITGTRFSQASPVPSVVAAGAAGTVQYTLTDVNSNPMVGVSISVSLNGVASAPGSTDLNGAYLFKYTAPNAPGTSMTLKASAGGVDSTLIVPIPGGGTTTVPIAAAPAGSGLNLSSNVVAVNTPTTSNQVAVNAFFRDSGNAPIPNIRVLFGVSGDNQTGSIGSGINAVLSDASGTASTTYTSGAVSSPTNGVTIKACWKISDFVATDTVANCTAAGGQLLTTTLTIVANPVSISIGTDNTISSGPSALTYVKKYVVLVVDSAGNPKSDVQITPSVDLGGYGKGYWAYNNALTRWQRMPDPDSVGLGLLTATCPNEDLNRNGVIDTLPLEDGNGNNQLDPRKSDVAIGLVGSTKTDANGVAVLQVEYPKSLGSWVKFKITVTAAGVLSPPAYYPMGAPVVLPSLPLSKLPSVEDYLSTYAFLPVAAADLSSVVAPAFQISPYGQTASCSSPN